MPLSHPAQATISIGIAGWLPASEPFEDAFRRAALALYRAKSTGGKLVRIAGIDDDPDSGTLPSPAEPAGLAGPVSRRMIGSKVAANTVTRRGRIVQTCIASVCP